MVRRTLPGEPTRLAKKMKRNVKRNVKRNPEGNVEENAWARGEKSAARRSFLLALACLLLASSCAAGGSRFKEVTEAPRGKALVYIYRPASFLGLGLFGGPKYSVGAGEERIVTLSAGGYYPYFAAPGRIDFWAHTRAMTVLPARLKAGAVYYLRGGIQKDIGVKRPSFDLVSEAVGRQEIAKCKLLPAATGDSD